MKVREPASDIEQDYDAVRSRCVRSLTVNTLKTLHIILNSSAMIGIGDR